jgi:hypothetical protein
MRFINVTKDASLAGLLGSPCCKRRHPLFSANHEIIHSVHANKHSAQYAVDLNIGRETWVVCLNHFSFAIQVNLG